MKNALLALISAWAALFASAAESERGALLRSFKAHEHPTNSVAFSPDGRLIASGSYRQLWLRNASDGQIQASFTGHDAQVSDLAFSPDGKLLASAGWPNAVRLWRTRDGALIGNMLGHQQTAQTVAFSPNGKYLASGGDEFAVFLWQAKATPLGSTSPASSLAQPRGAGWISPPPRGARGASAAGARPLKTLTGHMGSITGVAFSPNGKLLASASKDATLRLWSLPQGKALAILRGHASSALWLAFSPDGHLLASGGEDKMVRLWRVPEGLNAAPPLAGHTNSVTGGFFSPDGAWLATVGRDRTIHMWGIPGGDLLRTFSIADRPFSESAALSPDGRILASGNGRGEIDLYEMPGVATPEEYFTRGKASAESGDLKKAQESLLLAAQLRPANGLYRNWLASVLAEGKEPLRALREFDRIRALPGGEATLWHYYLGLALVQAGRYPEAHAAFSASLSDGPDKNRGREHGQEAREYLRKIELQGAIGAKASGKGIAIELSAPPEKSIAPDPAVLYVDGRPAGRLEPKSRPGKNPFDSASSIGGGIAVLCALLLAGWRLNLGREKALARRAETAGKKISEALAKAPGANPLAEGARHGGPAGQGAAPGVPDGELDGALREFKLAGGSPDRFSPEELFALVSADRFVVKGLSLAPAKSIALADRLAKGGRADKGAELLNEKVAAAAAGLEGGAETVLRVHQAAGTLDGFLQNRLGEGKATTLYPPYARALLRLGRHREALTVMQRAPVAEWSEQDTLCVFELYVRLGAAEQARALLPRIQSLKAPAADPEFFYRLGCLAEAAPDAGVAASLFALLSELDGGYKDSRARRTRLELQAARPTRIPSGATPLPALAASKEPAPLPALAPAPSPAGAPALIAGKYDLGAQIGAGGTGIVFLGYDHAVKRKIVLKRMHSAFRSNKTVRERFLQGARIVAQLTHPYIVAIHDVVEHDQEIFLVFDYIEGRSLDHLLEEHKRLDLADCTRIFDHVCQAVDAAHRGRVLHRDLKPSNIIVDKNGFAKVLDFDLAREAKDTISKLTQSDSSGTLAYMAPEQHLGDSRRASDVYSLGISIYETLTGTLPFSGPDFLAQKERKKYPPPSFLAPGLPKSIDLLISAALEPDAKRRIADALELLEMLKDLRS